MNHRPHGGRLASSRLAKPILLALSGLLIPVLTAPAEAKTPGATYCFLGVCHRVKSLAETQKAVGQKLVLRTSFYDDPKRDRLNPSRITSSGEYLRAERADNAASPIYPDGTKMLVWHPQTKKALVVRINNAGPYYGSRTLDVSRGAAEKLGFARRGTATLHARVISAPTTAEARYRKGRTYAPVPGFIGIFDTIETALLEVGRAVDTMLASNETPAAKGETTVATPKGSQGRRVAQRKQKTVVASAQPEVQSRKSPAVVNGKSRKARLADAKVTQRASHRVAMASDADYDVPQRQQRSTRSAAVVNRDHDRSGARHNEARKSTRRVRVAQEPNRGLRRDQFPARQTERPSDNFFELRMRRGA